MNEQKQMTRKERGQAPASLADDRPTVAPPVDIYENDDGYLIVADLPGVREESLHIHLDREGVSITARRDRAHDEGALIREFDAVEFRRSFRIPDRVDGEKVEANLSDGVLRLRLPKSEAVKPRKIAVSSG
ncbi:MAG: Hsp20/alpha crystallin family protein [Nannocystaceae bacterium]|nr:Hsp20/alpha crystallin family protein [Myxococcales bacterium]